MGFPITVNGRTWTLAEFQTGEHSSNLGPFLYDCLADFYKKFSSVAVTGFSAGAGSKSLTMEAGKAFVEGQTIKVTGWDYGSEGELVLTDSYDSGVIQSYNSGTGALDYLSVVYQGSASCSGVYVCLSAESAENATSPVSVANGGTAVATLALAKKFIESGSPQYFMKPLMEDFIGYFPALLSSSSPVNFRRFNLEIAGAARFLSDGNITASVDSVTKAVGVLDGSHPGVAVLEVTSPGDSVNLTVGGGPISCLRAEAAFKICFFLPTTNTATNAVEISLGLKSASANGSVLKYASLGTLTFEVHGSFDTGLALASAVLEAGHWYELSISQDGGGGYSYALYKDLTTYYDGGVIGPPGLDQTTAYQPFITISKTIGAEKRSLLVDYIYWGSPVTR